MKCAVVAGLSPLLKFLPAQAAASDFSDWSDSDVNIPIAIKMMRQMENKGYPPAVLFVNAATAKIICEKHPEVAKDLVVYGDGAYVDDKFIPFIPDGTIVARQ